MQQDLSIGSHVWMALLDAGLDIVAVDNLTTATKPLFNGYNPCADGRWSFGTPTSGMKRQSTKYFVLAE
ncbi:MAG: hypothetical protein QOG73_4238 [Acetobacteraceae bacterium]|nr:hypothetical protein [Acetobacteraceae bacterium]